MSDLLFDIEKHHKRYRKQRYIKLGVGGIALLAVAAVGSAILLSTHPKHINAMDTASTTLSTAAPSSTDAQTPSISSPVDPSPQSVEYTPSPDVSLSVPPDTYTNVDGNQVESPDYNSNGATAMCVDGTFSHSQNPQGTCSGHGGVDHFTPTASTPSPTPAASCNEGQKSADETSYNAAVAQENQRHQDAIANIQAQNSQQLDGMGSGLGSNAITQENQTNQQNLASLQAHLNSELASIGCS